MWKRLRPRRRGLSRAPHGLASLSDPVRSRIRVEFGRFASTG